MMMTLKYENNGAQPSSANICCCRRRQSAIIYSDVWISHCIAISRFSYFRCTIHSFLALSHHLVFPFFFLNRQNHPFTISRSWLFYYYMRMCNMHTARELLCLLLLVLTSLFMQKVFFFLLPPFWIQFHFRVVLMVESWV